MKKVILLSTIYLLSLSFASAQSVDLLWQGDGYVPPFYKGRALWSNQSRITLLAVPQGLGGAANLNYKWSQNGTVLGSLSGIGKNTLSFNDSVLSKPQTIKVEIVSNNDDTLAESSQVITPVSPGLLIYENNPLYGYLFHREVQGIYPLREAEITFDAFPFLFGAKEHSGSLLSYKWRDNNGEVNDKSSVTYRTVEGTSGNSLISVSLTSKDKILQTADKSFLVQFGQE